MPAPPPDSTADVLRSIRRVARAVTLRSRELATTSGLTVPQLLCLRVLAEAEAPPTLAELAQAVELSPATVTGLADRLERAGLVVRQRVDRDRRRVRLALTEAGRARAEDLPSSLHERFVARFAALPPAERARLQDALDSVVEMLGADDLDATPGPVAGRATGAGDA
jgi:DNA-binding MarR family transcriptional regulator